MRNIKNKRGSHVEIVISFAIFVIFLVFLYAALEPAVRKPKSKEYILESIKTRIIDYVSEDVYSYSLELKEDTNDMIGGFFIISEPTMIQFNSTIKAGADILNSLFYFSESENTNLLTTQRQGDNYKIYSSKEFSKGVLPPSGKKIEKCNQYLVDISCYEIIQTKTEKHIFQTKIGNMSEEYETSEGMLNLINNFRIPSGTNFWFNVTNESRAQLIAPDFPKIEGNVNIYVEEIPINFINEKNDPENKQKGFMTIEIW